MYDFKTVIPRKNTGSSKWIQMYEWNPNVDEDVVPLSVADMELKNPPEVIEGLKKYLDNSVLGYTQSYDAYFESVKKWMKEKHNYDVKREWMINTPGVVNAFFGAVNAFTNPGDGVIIMRPVYYPFSMAIDMNERDLVNCPLLKDENGKYTIDFDKFEELCKVPENKLLIFCSPHNPVGRVWTKEELKRVGEIATRNNVLIVCDEIWNDIIMPGYEHTVMATISEEIANNTIICTSVSKTFNLAGLAVSNIFIQNEEIREKYIDAMLKMRSLNVNILGYKACEIAYNESENWLKELLELLDKNQRLVKDYFDEHHPKLTSNYIEGTYLQWIDFNALGMTNEELEEFMHKKAQFFTDEGYIFGSEGDGFERINVACPTDVLLRQLEKLSKALKAIGF
ncbi:MAG: MalY/PatB family protein [Tissierellia bacterium]|nr:MalY/PatB family protein [Tissierellia bacterium]